MKLHESQRSKVAEAICRRWLKRRKARMVAPKVYVVQHQPKNRRYPDGTVWGWCHHAKPIITLHYQTRYNKRDMMILLAHEFAHHYDYLSTVPSARRKIRPHGERFQRIFWGTLARGLWKRASHERWTGGRSAHRPEFQP